MGYRQVGHTSGLQTSELLIGGTYKWATDRWDIQMGYRQVATDRWDIQVGYRQVG